MLVGRSLKMLPKPLAVISYADSGAGHVGYIYQATNWHYTGISKGHPEYTIDGKVYHEKNVYNKFGTGSVKKLKEMGLVVTTKRMGDKHRYYFFLGTKQDKRNMINALNFPLIPYPKGKTKRHNFDKQIETQSFDIDPTCCSFCLRASHKLLHLSFLSHRISQSSVGSVAFS